MVFMYRDRLKTPTKNGKRPIQFIEILKTIVKTTHWGTLENYYKIVK